VPALQRLFAPRWKFPLLQNHSQVELRDIMVQTPQSSDRRSLGA
jgi:hypothetical protein